MLYVISRLLLIYLGLVVGLTLIQRKLLYHPDRHLQPPAAYGLSAFDDITLTTADGLRLTAWYAPPAAADGPVIVYFHGNGGHLGYRADRYRAFHRAGFGVLALEYRGYGGNPGKISETGLYDDARAAMAYLRQQGVAEGRTVLFGESLGTGVAVQLALESAPRLVVLEAPFTSVAERAQELYYYIPARWLVWDRFDSRSKIGRVRSPVLILHGTNDGIVPHRHGQALLAAANEPKRGLFLDGVGHTAIPPQQMIDAIQAFVRDTEM